MNTSEPRRLDGQSIETEYEIEHPLIGEQFQITNNTRAFNLFFKSWRFLQDGNERRGQDLYQEALKKDLSLHTHAIDILSKMAQSCSAEEKGSICYWLGIHNEYLEDEHQALLWYTKSINAFHKIGYLKREGRARCNLGKVKMKLEDPSGMDEFEKAILLNPMDGIAHINIGAMYYIAGEYEQALDAFSEAIWADPNRYSRAVILRLKRLSEYTWEENWQEIEKRVAKKQGVDFDTLTSDEFEDIVQANHFIQTGNRLFQSGRYKEALEQFEQGKLITDKVAGNFLGVSMVTMHMIAVGEIPENQIPFYLEKADQNIDECIRIAPTNLEYLNAKNIISDYKKRYNVE
jgi:tetratricopeptide (TPR) repeat protein